MRYEKLIINILNPHIISDNSESSRERTTYRWCKSTRGWEEISKLFDDFFPSPTLRFWRCYRCRCSVGFIPTERRSFPHQLYSNGKSSRLPAQTTQHISSSFLVPLSHWIKFEKWTHIHELGREGKNRVKFSRSSACRKAASLHYTANDIFRSRQRELFVYSMRTVSEDYGIIGRFQLTLPSHPDRDSISKLQRLDGGVNACYVMIVIFKFKHLIRFSFPIFLRLSSG